MNPIESFKKEVIDRIDSNATKAELKEAAQKWMELSVPNMYVYNYTWLGRPIIQFPEDIVALQELVWATKPDLVIETGIAHGGSLIFYASMLELLGGERKVLGIDIDIRAHNLAAIQEHPFAKRIELLQGSSVSAEVIAKVKTIAAKYKKVMVVLDSNHTHEHVAKELELYAPLVSAGMYLVVLDTWVEHLPEKIFKDRPWDKGNNPMTAVFEFLKKNPQFEIDKRVDNKIIISAAPNGYLKRVK